MGDNIPGKLYEYLNFVGGFPEHTKVIWNSLDNGFDGM